MFDMIKVNNTTYFAQKNYTSFSLVFFISSDIETVMHL